MTAEAPNRLPTGPIVLDGGLSTALEQAGHDLRSALWTARLLRDDPDAIRQAHTRFFEAGAHVATTASYQASVDGFAAAGMDPAEARRLIRSSVAVARQARDAACPQGLVAASVGPYGAVLADGSEYRGDYGLNVTQLREFHRPRLSLLVEAGPDLLALETIPCLAEVEALLAEVDGTGVPAWLSLTAAGDQTRLGEPLSEAFAMAADVAEIVAVGVNCCDPADVLPALDLVATQAHSPGVAYPNKGQQWNPVTKEWAGDGVLDAECVQAWLAAGARFVGGCCSVGPSDIRAIADAVTQRSPGAGAR